MNFCTINNLVYLQLNYQQQKKKTHSPAESVTRFADFLEGISQGIFQVRDRNVSDYAFFSTSRHHPNSLNKDLLCDLDQPVSL